jgi:hypothetical protein
MNRLAIWLAGAMCVTVLGAEPARAQPPGVRQPAFSPYLNLLRPGGTPALNYYGLVRPEQQFRQSIQTLQTGVAANQQALGAIQTGGVGLPATGHPTQFLNYGGYFLNNGPSLGRGVAASPATVNRPAQMTAPRRGR